MADETDRGAAAWLTFGQLEGCLAQMMRVANHKRATFVSRLKQWQKMGFPEVAKVGRGGRSQYRLEHLFQLMIMMQLLRLGLTPERAIGYVTHTWPRLRQGFIESFDLLAEGAPAHSYAVVHLNALSEIEGDDRPVMATATVDIVRDAEFAALWYGIDEGEDDEAIAAETAMRGYSSQAWQERMRISLACSVMIELTRLCIAAMQAISTSAGLSLADFAPEFTGWREAHADWYNREGEADDLQDVRAMASDTREPTWREEYHAFVQGFAKELAGEPPPEPEPCEHRKPKEQADGDR